MTDQRLKAKSGNYDIKLTTLAPLAGRWQLSSDSAVYERPQENAYAPFGLAISGHRLRSGRIRATVVFPEQQSVGRVVFGHDAATGGYFSAGLGGYHYAYLLDEYIPGTGWRGLRTEGSESNLSTGTPYKVEVQVRGQRVRLFVNSVRVLEGNLPHPMSDDQIGLFAFGSAPVQFSRFEAEIDEPKVFVVMQFGEPYDTLYRDVIAPVAEEMKLAPYKANDVYRPGLVLQDIIAGLVESEIIVRRSPLRTRTCSTNLATPMRWGNRRFSWRRGVATCRLTFKAIVASSTTIQLAGRRRSRRACGST